MPVQCAEKQENGNYVLQTNVYQLDIDCSLLRRDVPHGNIDLLPAFDSVTRLGIKQLSEPGSVSSGELVDAYSQVTHNESALKRARRQRLYNMDGGKVAFFEHPSCPGKWVRVRSEQGVFHLGYTGVIGELARICWDGARLVPLAYSMSDGMWREDVGQYRTVYFFDESLLTDADGDDGLVPMTDTEYATFCASS